MNEPGGRAPFVIGLGNPIMGDDGLGVAALERLREGWTLPEPVRLVDGGTCGMNLLPLIEAAERIVFIDAIDAGKPVGALVQLEREELPHFLGLKLSPHQIDLREVLALAELRGTLPSELVAIGLQPGRVELSSGLSPELECRVDQLVAAVVERLERWGYPTEPVVAAERTVDRLLSEGYRP
jgi:hydrogenase maturation protease